MNEELTGVDETIFHAILPTFPFPTLSLSVGVVITSSHHLRTVRIYKMQLNF